MSNVSLSGTWFSIYLKAQERSERAKEIFTVEQQERYGTAHWDVVQELLKNELPPSLVLSSLSDKEFSFQFAWIGKTYTLFIRCGFTESFFYYVPSALLQQIDAHSLKKILDKVFSPLYTITINQEIVKLPSVFQSSISTLADDLS